jgi:hypothetical protein
MSFLMLAKSYSGLLNCESRVKEPRNFPRSSDKRRNEYHVNMVEYSSESSDDEEADMCVAE